MQTLKLWLLLLFTVSSYHLSAQQSHLWKQASSNGYSYKYVTNDPMKARFYTLKNGLSVILTENHKEPRIAVNIAVRAGSNHDPKEHTGLAHYLEHLLFKGTDVYGTLNWKSEKPYIDSITNLYEKYTTITKAEEREKTYREIDRLSGEASKYSIANEYDKLMSGIGSQGTNAHTWVEETVYEEDIPSNSIDKFLMIQAERFRAPVFRLFHTELEAVYEEKNRTLDNDGSKMQEAMMYYLFPTHNYGQQSTIGTIGHLKNPSINAIRKFYNSYYVPNNMSVIMAGDFNADELIKKIDQHFAYMKPRPLQLYNPAAEKPLSAPIVKDIYGPNAENIIIAYRTPAANTHDALVLDLIANILSNGAAGLLDINLNKAQKVQAANAGMDQYKDYGIFTLMALPKEGQLLEELKPLLLAQLQKIKEGDFSESLLKAIIANYKLIRLQEMEINGARLQHLMDAFIKNRGEQWHNDVADIDNMSKVTRQQIQQVANKYFGDNYVLLNKRKGADQNITKVEKPPITPVETNAGKASSFVQTLSEMPVKNIMPQWINYDSAIVKTKAGIADVLYVQNKDNDLFNLYYRFDMGSWNDIMLARAVEYLQFLGTDKLSAEQISKAFYHIACRYNINVSNEITTVSISGLQENFDKAVTLFEQLIANCRPDENALADLKDRWMKSRANSKLNKSLIARGLINYAQYGEHNPYNAVLSNEQLNNIKSSELVNKLHTLFNYKHRILYYGPQAKAEFTASIAGKHRLPQEFIKYPKAQVFTFSQQKKNEVLFANYDMVQSEIYWIRNIKPYNFNQEAVVDVFNNYFGGGMGGVVFQTIRESKALAYSTFASYITPAKKEDPFSALAYVGSQSDKMVEAIKGMNELMNELPPSSQRFSLAVEGVKKDLETERIVKDGIIFSYLDDQKMGFDTDRRETIYQALNSITLKDVEQLHKVDLADKPYTYCVVASDSKINMSELKKIGDIKELSLEEIFGY